MFNNDDDIENINTEKFFTDDDIYKYDYSIKEEGERDEEIKGINILKILKKILIIK